MRKILLTFLVAFVSIESQAQQDTLTTDAPRLTIMVDAGQIINPIDRSLMISSEIFLNQYISIVPEIGVFGMAEDQANEELDRVDVKKFLKFQQGVRFYLGKFENTGINVFLGGTVQYRKMTVNETYIIGYECEEFGSSCVYYRNITDDLSTERFSYALNFGATSKLSKRFILSYSYGVGVQNYTIDRTPIFDGKFVENDRYIEEEKLGRNPFMSIAVKFGYLIF